MFAFPAYSHQQLVVVPSLSTSDQEMKEWQIVLDKHTQAVTYSYRHYNTMKGICINYSYTHSGLYVL